MLRQPHMLSPSPYHGIIALFQLNGFVLKGTLGYSFSKAATAASAVELALAGFVPVTRRPSVI